MISAALQIALTDPGDPPVRLLPPRAAELLAALEAPPKLAAHLRLVHDVACELTGWLGRHYPELTLDVAAVHFGAAVHDIGKALYPAELGGPGSAHEQAGYDLLRANGIPDELARFARTHASWSLPGTTHEDLVVSVADKVWKAKRVVELEHLLVERLAAASGQPEWQVFAGLDELLGTLAQGADTRLAFQEFHA